MKLQIEKNPMTLCDETTDQSGTFGREELTSNLQTADAIPETDSELGGLHGVINVERD
jgi:hypothetical protein